MSLGPGDPGNPALRYPPDTTHSETSVGDEHFHMETTEARLFVPFSYQQICYKERKIGKAGELSPSWVTGP
jgi:hypothetical protein